MKSTAKNQYNTYSKKVFSADLFLSDCLQEQKKKSEVSRADNWGNETATAREKEIAEEEERKNKEAKCKVCNVRTGVDAWAGW